MDKEKTFEWNDELVSELLWSRFPFPDGVTAVKPILEEFKKGKLKEEVKPTVKNMWADDSGCHIWMNVNEENPFNISKERLAEILIAEAKGELFMDNEEDRKQRKLISDKEFLQFGEDCFKAARHTEKKIGEFSIYEEYKYKSLSDFINSQKPKRTLKQIIGSYINSK